MMNKIKNLFLLILCFGLMSGAIINVSAQTGGSLKQSDVDKVIEFYEWALNTKFTNEQRSQFQELQEEGYQKDPAGERKSIDNLLANYSAIKAKSENDQERIRGVFIDSFIESSRKSDEAEAKLLVSVYDGAQETAAAQIESADGDISSIVGKWAWAHTGSSTISTVGTYMGSNGSRFTYQFSPDGTVEFTGIMNVMQGSCNQQIFRSIKGKANLSGNNLTIRWAPERFTHDFSCDTANNYTKTMPARIETRRISFKNDLGQKQLCFVGAECFSPTNK